ncbi:2388_t:CDS:2 [Ambispora gerdemannii]|uniref:2388_t:CDS:1 n=1 Tax=Ambispora gerdemannii TaxID=144530 RepID=A0A9N9CBZ9_9GLOM|nr:2388_t:CDS:2 [Ambispora gerdemannii]
MIDICLEFVVTSSFLTLMQDDVRIPNLFMHFCTLYKSQIELLKAFSSITNPGWQDERLRECILGWFSQHKEFTEIQIVEHLKQVARNNYKYACLLGFCYDKGFGTFIDPQKAFQWYLRAAEQNDSFGQNQVGYFYQNGIGTKVNDEKAFYWYQRSADNGCSEGKSNLGSCYEYGTHVKQDRKYAFYWYSKSAEMGDELGKWDLADMFFYGLGTNVDVHRALKLYLEAKNLGCMDVEYYVRNIFINSLI